ncbi:class I SAM-dependent methyltransferase [candidate division KSB1 bacterium]|nr:class I SAM-dependent methyltransferase [candidate division KSB1 bacterium]
MKRVKSKINVFNEETLNYVQKFITNKDLRILEVGFGSGDLGYELLKTGIALTALDTDAKAVELAIKKGVPAKHLDFLSFKDDPFDIILFTRSLHHIHNLKKTLHHTKLLLKKGGKLIIEDFDREMVDLNTTRWYYDTISILSAIIREEKFSEYIKDPLKAWQEDHSHEPPLHSGKEMIKEIEENFGVIKIERNAYLYRSICSRLKDDETGYHITKRIFEIENGLIAESFILPNGLRIVAEN